MHGIISPVVVVPGIIGSDLHNEYELPPEAVWTAVKRRYEDVTLHPADQRYELHEPARIVAGGPFPVVYEELIQELRDGLSDEEDVPVPVFPFGYDWRVALERTEKRLAAFVEEVIHRTLLIPHYRNNEHYRKQPTVSLIGHSMGGLIIAGYIGCCSGLRVDKVITLGTPYQGSYEAVVKVVTGTGGILGFGNNARERKTARLTPSLYYLVPACGGLVVDPGVVDDLFDACAWQTSVVDSIVERAKKWGVCGCDLFRAMLAQGKAHRDRVSGLKLSEPNQPDSPSDQVSERNWLAVVGVDSETRVGLRIVSEDDGKRRFVLSRDDRRNEWKSGNVAARRDTGDGVVSVAGAIPSFLEESRVVCVTPGDFHWGEVDDHALRVGTHFHASLPSMNMLQRLIVRFLSGKNDRHGNTWGRRLPGVVQWDPPLNLNEKDKPDLISEGN